MAESYRPLSRHNVKISGNTSPIIHTVHSMDAAIHTDYGEVSVYETTVRPVSRRAEGVNRPKSGYNNRLQRERARKPATSDNNNDDDDDDDGPVDRPRTSRGYRDDADRDSQYSLSPVTRERSITPRPKSGYGARRHSKLDDDDVTMTSRRDTRRHRPKSRRGKRPSHASHARTPPAQSGMLQRERTFYDGDEARPGTRHGRANSRADSRANSRANSRADSRGNGHYPDTDPTSHRNTSNPSQRPKTGRGRRRKDSYNEEHSGPVADEEIADPIERPRTSRGSRRRSLSEYSGDGSPTDGGRETEVMGDDKRQNTRTKRRHHVPIDLSYMSPRQPPTSDTTPSPTPRPPTGRRSKASRKKRTMDQPPTPSYSEYERQRTMTSSMTSSRPTSSSFNRYQPLPAIGTGTRVPDGSSSSPSHHIHIPHGTSNVPSDTQYHDNRYSDNQYPNNQYPDSQYPDTGYSNAQYPDTEYPDTEYPPPHTTPGQTYLSEKTRQLHLEEPPGPDGDEPPGGGGADPAGTDGEEEEGGSMYPRLDRNIVLPPEPEGPGEDRVILALKLPDGTRVQRRFYTRDTLRDVRSFAEVEAELDFSHCELVCDVPRKVYRDLSVAIAESGLQDRTVLHVQVPDDHL